MEYSALLHSNADIMLSHPFNRLFKLKPQTSRVLLDGDDDVVAHVARTVWFTKRSLEVCIITQLYSVALFYYYYKPDRNLSVFSHVERLPFTVHRFRDQRSHTSKTIGSSLPYAAAHYINPFICTMILFSLPSFFCCLHTSITGLPSCVSSKHKPSRIKSIQSSNRFIFVLHSSQPILLHSRLFTFHLTLYTIIHSE